MTFQGSLSELPLPDIIQLVSVSGKTGRFDLSNEDGKGQIYLRDGQIVHATANTLQGEEAVYELAIWSAGSFVFVPNGVPSQTTIDKSNTNLLMEAARRIDEWQVLSKKIASTHLVPVFTEQSVNTSVSFTPQEWAIICKMDQRRTIEEIALTLGASPFETCKQLYGLVASGLVALRPNLLRHFGPRLRLLGDERLLEIAIRVHGLARPLLDSVDESGRAVSRLDKALELARNQLLGGVGAEATLDFVRTGERLVFMTRGEAAADQLIEEVDTLID